MAIEIKNGPIKRGTTLEFTIEFTETEWNEFYPFTAIKCEAEIKRPPLNVDYQEYEFSSFADAETRTIVLTSVSSDEWPTGITGSISASQKTANSFSFLPMTFSHSRSLNRRLTTKEFDNESIFLWWNG